jgi:hypothetical protein
VMNGSLKLLVRVLQVALVLLQNLLASTFKSVLSDADLVQPRLFQRP